jgi:hypothetical protein
MLCYHLGVQCYANGVPPAAALLQPPQCRVALEEPSADDDGRRRAARERRLAYHSIRVGPGTHICYALLSMPCYAMMLCYATLLLCAMLCYAMSGAAIATVSGPPGSAGAARHL